MIKTRLSLIILIIASLLSANAVLAATVTLVWDAPTTNTDDTPITYFAGDYTLYRATVSGGPYIPRPYQRSGSEITIQSISINPGSYCWVATASNTLGNESGYSNEVCKTIDPTGNEGSIKIISH